MVLIVDEHEEFRRTARALLEAGGFEVVREAGDRESAIASRDFTRGFYCSTCSSLGRASGRGAPPDRLE